MLQDVEGQLQLFELLRAMYPLPTDLDISDETLAFLDANSTEQSQMLEHLQSLDAVVHLQLDDEAARMISVSIKTSIVKPEASLISRQPAWMTRSTFETAFSEISPMTGGEALSDYVLDTLESIKEEASKYPNVPTVNPAAQSAAVDEDIPTNLQRVWFWFPSLSSKEKRRDLVEYAAEYDLKGFVLAGEPRHSSASSSRIEMTGFWRLGKPGLLCLEGNGAKVDKYLSAIKSESWSDIPSYHKKVRLTL